MEKKVYLESLGCAKNQVDSEMMLGALEEAKFIIIDKIEEAEIIIVNTCGFIESAQQESIDVILDYSRYKDPSLGKCELLIATGCLVEKHRRELLKEIPELDAVLGTQEYLLIANLINNKLEAKNLYISGFSSSSIKADSENSAEAAKPNPEIEKAYRKRTFIKKSPTAYLKISEGCNNKCSYCLIPSLRGPLKSRKIDGLIEEAEFLAERGIKELIVIAQDTTAYGVDMEGVSILPELLDRLAGLPFIWIRILYVYPGSITTELLEVMAKHDKICNYLDMPIQHANDKVLKAMNRKDNKSKIRRAVKLCRSYMPDIALRTTFMVGFPGETEEQLQEALNFILDMKFDWVGVFKYSKMANTVAYDFPNQISEETKEQRYELAMNNLADLSAATNEKWFNQEMLALIEDEDDEYFLGRNQYQAPDVDGIIYIKKCPLNTHVKVGDFVQVKIIATDTYDVIGDIVTD